MNDEHENLARQLEQATSTSVPDAALDPETSRLREGWCALSRALEASHTPFDEAHFAAKLQADLLAPSTACPAPRPEDRRTYWGWALGAALLGGALAASLLVAFAVVGYRAANQPQQIVKKSPAAGQKQFVATPGEPDSLSSTGASQHDAPWSWDDPLDSQISVAATQMETMQKPALPLDTSISTLNWHLQQMAQDLEEGAL
jgi:hypothetical protein